MPNFGKHIAIGAAASVGTYLGMCRYLKCEPKLGELLLCLGVGTLAASLPDVLDPPSHPDHRAVGHSLALGAGLVALLRTKCSEASRDLDTFSKILLAASAAAYLSHLAADGCTPKGLPLLGL